MANIKSQIKRNKQNEKRRMRNKAVKSELKTYVRKFREAADAGDTEAATVAMQAACRKLDKAVSKGVIHKNQAANRKSPPPARRRPSHLRRDHAAVPRLGRERLHDHARVDGSGAFIGGWSWAAFAHSGQGW